MARETSFSHVRVERQSVPSRCAPRLSLEAIVPKTVRGSRDDRVRSDRRNDDRPRSDDDDKLDDLAGSTDSEEDDPADDDRAHS